MACVNSPRALGASAIRSMEPVAGGMHRDRDESAGIGDRFAADDFLALANYRHCGNARVLGNGTTSIGAKGSRRIGNRLVWSL